MHAGLIMADIMVRCHSAEYCKLLLSILGLEQEYNVIIIIEDFISKTT